ncbi:MAG: hypothetical protein JKY52_17305, partial [Flavobacteriales bacterium]|nr:hypothetical protein [Flavobacteriales bacterium]
MHKQIESIGKCKLGFWNTVNPAQAGLGTGNLGGLTGQGLQGKYRALVLVFSIAISLFNAPTVFSQVGIGTTTPDASAILDLTSTTKGILISRVTLVQRNAIVSPATGLLVYQTDNTPGYYYNSGTPGVPNWLRLLNNSSADNDWTLDGDTLYSGPDSTVVIRNGNVGIGTNAPWVKLHVDHVGDENAAFQVGDVTTVTSRTGVYLRSTTEGRISVGSGAAMTFFNGGSAGTERMRIDAAGNVGIGTTSPSTLNGGTALSGKIVQVKNVGGHAQFFANTTGANQWAVLGLEVGDATVGRRGFQWRYDGANNGVKAVFFNETTGTDVVNPLTLKNDGNVGIGTITPGAKLEVAGQIKITGGTPGVNKVLTSDAAGLATWQVPSGPAADYSNGGEAGLADRTLGNTDNFDLGFLTNNINRLHIQNDGNVGIGTSAPQHRLQVEGTVKVSAGADRQGVVALGDGGSTTVHTGIYRGGLGHRTSYTNNVNDNYLNLIGFRGIAFNTDYTNYADAQATRMLIDGVTGNVGIGTTSPSALLEVASTTSGIIIPRVTLVQRNAIVAPVTSELVFQTDNTPGYYYWDGAAWVQMLTGSGTGSGWATTGNAGTTVGTNFLGTTDAQDLAIYTNSAERLRVTSAGNVGIGTVVPTGKLTILKEGTATVGPTSGELVLSGTTPQLFLDDNDAGVDEKLWDFLATNTISNFRLVDDANTAGTNWLEVERSGTTVTDVSFPNGNVGIGTTSPGVKLEVAAPINSTALGLQGIGYTAPGQTSDFVFLNGTHIYSGISNITGTPSWSGDLAFYTNPGTVNGSAVVERMRILNSGNVGIGTTTPGAKLDVGIDQGDFARFGVGGTRISMGRSSTNYPGIGHNVDFDPIGGHKYIASETAALLIFNAGDFRFQGAASGAGGSAISWNTNMTIKQNGNVGIGTTSPSALLEVASTTSGIIIPRVTLVQRNAIVAPVTSELVFQTDNTPGYYYWDGAAWVQMLTGSGSGSGWATTGNAGTTVGTNFLGTTDAQDLAIYTNNAEKIRVTSAGNVGIGTTSPNDLLDVTGTVRLQGVRSTQGNTDLTFDNQVRFAYDALNLGIDKLLFYSGPIAAGNEVVTFDNSGNVGIGTTTPDRPFVINSANNSLAAGNGTALIFGESNKERFEVHSAGGDPGFLAKRAGGTWAAPTAVAINKTLSFLGGAGYDGTSWVLGSKAAINLRSAEAWTPTANATYITLETTPIGSTVRTERVRITENGNVGIGIGTPTGKLDVRAANTHTTGVYTGSGHLLLYNDQNNADELGAFLVFGSNYNDGIEKVTMRAAIKGGTDIPGNNGAGYLAFYTVPTPAGNQNTERMRIDQNGNVGIGTTGPAYKLDIEGIGTSGGLRISPKVSTNRVFQVLDRND